MLPYRVSGSYYEACNCDAICPCRSIGGRPGGASTHGVCFGTLSWWIEAGRAGELDLTGLKSAMSIRYRDEVQPSTPWEVILYVDERGTAAQRTAIENIFLGRYGGTSLNNFAAAIGDVIAVRPARIDLIHTGKERRISIENWVEVVAGPSARQDEAVACGIPGLNRPGRELTTDRLRSADTSLEWNLTGTCGFTTDFDYMSDGYDA